MSAKLTLTIPVWLDFIFTLPVIAYRQLKYGYSFRKIDLGDSVFTIVEPLDYYRLNCFKWTINGNGIKFYAVRYAKIGPGKTKTIRLHREIMNPPAGLLVDHRNLDSLDNRRANLRIATHSQNQCNKSKTKSRTLSRFVGVTRDKNRSKWEARLKHHGKKIWLGRFDSEIDAARAYDRAAIKYHKEFARLNFPEEN
jgi:hypothetical protein